MVNVEENGQKRSVEQQKPDPNSDQLHELTASDLAESQDVVRNVENMHEGERQACSQHWGPEAVMSCIEALFGIFDKTDRRESREAGFESVVGGLRIVRKDYVVVDVGEPEGKEACPDLEAPRVGDVGSSERAASACIGLFAPSLPPRRRP